MEFNETLYFLNSNLTWFWGASVKMCFVHVLTVSLRRGLAFASGLQAAMDMQEKVTARREEIDTLQGKIQELEDAVVQLRQVKTVDWLCGITVRDFELKLVVPNSIPRTLSPVMSAPSPCAFFCLTPLHSRRSPSIARSCSSSFSNSGSPIRRRDS